MLWWTVHPLLLKWWLKNRLLWKCLLWLRNPVSQASNQLPNRSSLHQPPYPSLRPPKRKLRVPLSLKAENPEGVAEAAEAEAGEELSQVTMRTRALRGRLHRSQSLLKVEEVVAVVRTAGRGKRIVREIVATCPTPRPPTAPPTTTGTRRMATGSWIRMPAFQALP